METSDQSAGSGYSDSDHDYLQSCISDFALLDMVSKAQLLQSLYSYLSSVAATMSVMEDRSLSATLGTTTVRLNHAEIIQLHDLLMQELQSRTDYLTKPHSIQSQAEGYKFDAILSRNLCLEVTSKTLRCFMRILPLVDCFDSSVSLSGAEFLVGLMQQLCSPGTLLDVLSRSLDESRCKGKQKIPPVPSCQPSQVNVTMSEVSGNDPLSHDYGSFETEGEVRQRMDAFLGILEVFIDEILLFPDLGTRFLALKDDAHLFFKRENMMTSFSGCTGAALEAAFMHALLSSLSKMRKQDTKQNTLPAEDSGVLNLSLPAGVVLLDSLTSGNVPQTYMSHIIHLVTRVLNSSTSRRIDEASDVIISSASTSAGVDWSYSLRKLGPKHDPLDYWVPKGRSLPSKSTVHYAASIFEQAMLLYTRFSTHSSAGGGNGGLAADNLFHRFCISKYGSLLDLSCRESDVEAEKPSAQRGIHLRELERNMFEILFKGSTVFRRDAGRSCNFHDHSCEEDEEERTCRGRGSSLVSAVLQLVISSLECITGEIEKMLRLSPDVSHQLPNGESVSSSECDIDTIFACSSFSISSFLSHDEHSGEVDSQASKSPGQRSLITSIGKAIGFFTNVFCQEVQSGAPEQLLEDYFRLLESFVALLLVVDGSKRLSPSFQKNSARNESNESRDNYCVQTLQGGGSNASSWLEAMVFRLENLLQELSSQQRALPEFFLNFVLEQITRGDGLNLVTVALSGCFETSLVGARNRHQSVITGPSYQPKGLVNQILELALQEPNRQSSILTLISYINNALEDLMPITGTLSLHEVSGTISCYEHIASVFTVACQFAVSASKSVVAADDSEYRSWLFARLCDGIQRLLVEGASVAEQISNWAVRETIPAMPSDTEMEICPKGSMRGEDSGNASDYEETWLQCSSNFLAQIELLRKAVDATHHATDWFLEPDSGSTSVSSKSRAFLEAVSRLMTTAEKPVRLRKYFKFLQEHFHAVCPLPDPPYSAGADMQDPVTEKQPNEEDPVVDRQDENDEASLEFDKRTAVGTPCPSERRFLQPEFEQDVGSIEDPEMDVDVVPEAETVPHVASSGPVVDLVEPTSSKRKRLRDCSSTTLAIVKKLTDVRQLPCRKVKRSIRTFSQRYGEELDIIPLMSREPGKEGRDIKPARHTDDVPAIAAALASNPFIETVREEGQEAFDDLKDFIVCKKGRNYGSWLKNRQFIRRRLYARTVFKRLQQKRDLQVLLDLFV